MERILDIEQIPKFPAKSAYEFDDTVLEHIYEINRVFNITPEDTVQIPAMVEVNGTQEEVLLSSIVDTGNLKVYNDYGIYFGDGIRKGDKRVIVNVSEEMFKRLDTKVFDEYFEDKLTSMPKGAVVFDCLIELTKEEQYQFYTEHSALGDDIEYLERLFKDYYICNPGIILQSSTGVLDELREMRAYSGCMFFNAAGPLLRHNCFTVTADRNIANQQFKAAVDEICELVNKNTIIYFDLTTVEFNGTVKADLLRNSSKLLQSIYAPMAAYMSLRYGYRFHVPKVAESYYSILVRSISSLTHNYLDRYLQTLIDPIGIGVMMRAGNPAFLYTRNKTVNDGLVVTMQCAEITLTEGAEEPLKLVSHEIIPARLRDTQFDIIPFTNIFNLHTTDFKAGQEAASTLHRFLSKAQEKFEITDRSLDCSNTILARINGKMYVCYVTNYSVKQTYTTRCLAKGYGTPMCKVLTEADLNALIDIRAFSDYPILVKEDQIAKLPAISDTAEGIISTFGVASQTNLTEVSGLCYDSVALWDVVCEDSRGAKVSSLLDIGLPVRGLRNSFLTVFGGPHPFLGHSTGINKPLFIIGQAMWR